MIHFLRILQLVSRHHVIMCDLAIYFYFISVTFIKKDALTIGEIKSILHSYFTHNKSTMNRKKCVF